MKYYDNFIKLTQGMSKSISKTAMCRLVSQISKGDKPIQYLHATALLTNNELSQRNLLLRKKGVKAYWEYAE